MLVKEQGMNYATLTLLYGLVAPNTHKRAEMSKIATTMTMTMTTVSQCLRCGTAVLFVADSNHYTAAYSSV